MFLNEALLIPYQLWCLREDANNYEITYFHFGMVIFIQKCTKNEKV